MRDTARAHMHALRRGRRSEEGKRIEYGLEGWIFYYFGPFCWSLHCCSVLQMKYIDAAESGRCFRSPMESQGDVCGRATWAVDYQPHHNHSLRTCSKFLGCPPPTPACICFNVMNANELVISHSCMGLALNPHCLWKKIINNQEILFTLLSAFVISELIRKVF